jgi:hypothetical protein
MTRSQLDLLTDDAYHRMMSAETPESRCLWGDRFNEFTHKAFYT